MKLTGIAISKGKIIQSPAGGCCAWLTTNQQDMGSGAYMLQVNYVTAESTQHQPSLVAGCQVGLGLEHEPTFSAQ